MTHRNSKPPDPATFPYGTDLQQRCLQSWIDLGTSKAAAEETGRSEANVRRMKQDVEIKAAKAGWAPTQDLSHLVPPGHRVKGKSMLLDSDGEITNQWLKTDADKEARDQAFRDFVTALCDEIVPAKPIKASKKDADPDLLSAIFIGDAHIGMYAYSPETKHADFDTDISAQGVKDAIDDLISRSPSAEKGMLVDVGDFMHMNSSLNKTLAGTQLDVDTRYSRVLRVSGQVMKYAITQMLRKFKTVVVVVAKGNHNEDPAVAVQEICSAYFHNEPRVNVLDTDGYFHYIEWGKWLIGVNHGDKIKAPKLASVMARDMAQAWGRTTHRMWATGHYHHEQVLELEGCTVYKFGALPPPDSWHSGAGFGGDGQMQMITFKRGGGKHSTLIYDIPRPIVEPDVVIK